MIAFVLGATDHGPLILNRLDYNENGMGVYGVGAQLMMDGHYDAGEVELFRNLLALRRQHFGDGVHALDCGANIGVHTVEWAKAMRGWGSVLAIEAQERLFYALAGNLALHNALNARALWAAVSDECDYITIPEPDYTVPSSFGSFELRPRLGVEDIGQPINYQAPSLRVRAISIDSLELKRVDFIKMDIEGMEEDALVGAFNTIERCRPILAVEHIKCDEGEIRRFLHDLNYTFYPHGMNTLAVHKDDPTRHALQVVRVEKPGVA